MHSQWLLHPVCIARLASQNMGCNCSDLFGEEDNNNTPLLTTIVDFTSRQQDFENVQDVHGAPTDKKWYHGAITNVEAETRLKIAQNDGSYIVYDNPQKKGQYILLVYYKRNLYRWKISRRRSDKKYILGNDGEGVTGYDTVPKLIKAHRGIRGKPIKLEHGGVLKLSKSYVYVMD